MRESPEPAPMRPGRLGEALHKARIEEAERTDAIVHLHADVARLARTERRRDRDGLGPGALTGALGLLLAALGVTAP